MTLKKIDDAISPVIGVMLMLVITVVVAGVITFFATGVVSDTEPAPTAVLDVKILTEYKASGSRIGPDFQIVKLAGDDIDTKYLEIRTSWTDQYGKYHYSTYSANEFKAEHPGGVRGALTMKQPLFVETSGTQELHIRTEFGSGGWYCYFGDHLLKPGFKVRTNVEAIGTPTGTYLGSPYMDVIFNNGETIVNANTAKDNYGIMEYLPKGTAVDVTIIHIPSNKAIFNKVVFVE